MRPRARPAIISGIGIGSTGPVLPLTGEFGDVNFFPNWKGENLVKHLSNLFRVRVALEMMPTQQHSAKQAGEPEKQAASDLRHHRNRYRHRSHHRWSSIPRCRLLSPRNWASPGRSLRPWCVCGFRGCWESLAAGPAMTAWMNEQAGPEYPHGRDLSAKRICELAAAGDELAKRAVDREAYYLGLGLANLVTMFCPDAIVLGGGVMKSASLFLGHIKDIIRQSCSLVPFDKTELTLASLGENANLIGAAKSGITDFRMVELKVNPDIATPDLRIIEGKYVEDILDQPRALDATLAGLELSQPLNDLSRRLSEGKFHRIVRPGMGSSFHALHPLNLQLVSQGFSALMVETSELIHYQSRFFDPKTLIVAVSQSGQSAEMVRLAEVNGQRSSVIAVTNTPESSLVKHSTAALFTQAGREFSVSCKTYVTALMVLKFLGDVLCQRDPEQSRRDLQVTAPVAEYLSRWRNMLNSWRTNCAASGICSSAAEHLLPPSAPVPSSSRNPITSTPKDSARRVPSWPLRRASDGDVQVALDACRAAAARLHVLRRHPGRGGGGGDHGGQSRLPRHPPGRPVGTQLRGGPGEAGAGDDRGRWAAPPGDGGCQPRQQRQGSPAPAGRGGLTGGAGRRGRAGPDGGDAREFPGRRPPGTG